MKRDLNFDKFSKTIRDIVQRTESRLANDVIIKKGDVYQVYGTYTLKQVDTEWVVETTCSNKHFGLAKSALAWCIAQKAGKYMLAHHIAWLDMHLEYKQIDIELITSKLKNKIEDPLYRVILESRLSEDIHIRQLYKYQLNKSVEMTKYIKIKGLQNEFSRLKKAS